VRSPAKKKAKRLRRSAADAREAILDAAEQRLAVAGPAGIRLQEVAADVGMSHPTVIHHFGSREGLVEAVVDRALDTIRRETIEALGEEAFEPSDAADLLRRVMKTLGDRGHARLLAWLALADRQQGDASKMLQGIAALMHARRVAETGRSSPPEDTLFVVVLASLALVAEGILGEATWDSAGLGKDAGAPDRFHDWLVDLLTFHLRHGPPEPAVSAGKPPARRRRPAT
jgi:AcrR family transcriptional regulator